MITVRVDATSVTKMLEETGRKGVRCLAIALTKTAEHADRALKSEIPRLIDRPTPFTMNATVVRPANYRNLTASVVFKDWQAKYLDEMARGGQRRWKRFELSLQAAGAMPAGWVAVPAKGVELDRFGNMGRGFLMKILSQIGKELASGYQNRGRDVVSISDGEMRVAKSKALAKNKARNGTFFAVLPGDRSGLPAGVYQRIRFAHGWGHRAVLMYVKKAVYRSRIDLQYFGQRAASLYLQDEFNRAFKS